MKAVRGELLLGVVTIVAAAGWVFSKKALEGFPPFSFMTLRFALAAIVLMFLCLPQLLALTRRDVIRSVFTGVVFGFTLMLWVVGLANTSLVGESAFIVSLCVVIVPVIGRLLFSEKIPPTLFFALVPAILGLVLLTLENGFRLEKGQWFFIAAAFGFALYLNLSSHVVSGIPAMVNTTIQLCVVSFVAAIFAFLFESWPGDVPVASWWWLIVSAVVATSFRFVLQNKALQTISPTYASIIFLLEPVWTVLLSVGMLDEVLPLSKMVGCCLIFAALLIFRGQAIIRYFNPRVSRP